jgi:hypothetical protein
MCPGLLIFCCDFLTLLLEVPALTIRYVDQRRYAAVFAAYVAGTATMVGMDFGAKFLSSLAMAFEVLLS